MGCSHRYRTIPIAVSGDPFPAPSSVVLYERELSSDSCSGSGFVGWLASASQIRRDREPLDFIICVPGKKSSDVR